MNPVPIEQRPPHLDEETQRLLSQTTIRMVNHAIERRFDSSIRASQETEAAARRMWPMVMTILAVVLLGSLLWLVLGAR